MEDMLLILRCKQGCRRSLARIYDKYKTDLLKLAISLLNDTAMVEDVVHDVFARLVGELHAVLSVTRESSVQHNPRNAWLASTKALPRRLGRSPNQCSHPSGDC